MTTLMVFRNDLRVADNTALWHAQQSGDAVIALFCYTPKQWQAHDLGPNKVAFIHAHVRALSEALAKLGIPLLIRSSKDFTASVKDVLKVARAHHVNDVHVNIQYEWNERERDKALDAALAKHDITLHRHVDHTVVHPSAIQTGSGDYYKVFTPYKRAWITHCIDQEIPQQELKIKKQKPISLKADPIPDRISGYHIQAALDGPLKGWPCGEKAAQKILRDFINQRVKGYKTARDVPALDATSRLSAYLAIGIISPRQCLRAALAANDGRLGGGDVGIDTWVSELIWREFYAHVIFGFPHICKTHAFKRQTDAIAWNDNQSHFDAWRNGVTGIPIVDAGMRQLRQTGWMHNRVRMIVAMFLSKNLFLDWRLGERHFNQHLIDADFASNNGGWQWSASTGTDAAPYFRIFNPYSQSARFDPDGEYIKTYVPELAELDKKYIHEPHKAPDEIFETLNYLRPIVDCKKTRQAAIDAFKSLGKNN